MKQLAMTSFPTVLFFLPHLAHRRSQDVFVDVLINSLALRSGHGMEWNGMENGMEWSGNFGMEYGRCQNGMEWKISRIE